MVISVSLSLLVSQQHPVLGDSMAATQLFQDNHLTICLKPVGIPLQSDHSLAGHCQLQNNTDAVSYDSIRFVEGYVFHLHAIVSISSRRRCILSQACKKKKNLHAAVCPHISIIIITEIQVHWILPSIFRNYLKLHNWQDHSWSLMGFLVSVDHKNKCN